MCWNSHVKIVSSSSVVAFAQGSPASFERIDSMYERTQGSAAAEAAAAPAVCLATTAACSGVCCGGRRCCRAGVLPEGTGVGFWPW